MSYCRWGPGSDVYMFPVVGGGIECCACLLEPESGNSGINNSSMFNTRTAALAHLELHVREGHQVSTHAIRRLQTEIKEERG